MAEREIKPLSDEIFLPINVLDWEDDIIFDPEIIEEYSKTDQLPKCGWIPTQMIRTYADFITAWKSGEFVNSFRLDDEPQEPLRPVGDVPLGPDEKHSIFPEDNEDWDSNSWERDVIWDPNNVPERSPRVLKLSYEDNPQLFGMPEDKLPPKRRSTVLEESELKGERRVQCGACGEYGHNKLSNACPAKSMKVPKKAPSRLSFASSRASIGNDVHKYKCSSCGAVGHTRASKLCPNFAERRESISSRPESRLSTGSSLGGGTTRKCGACGALGHTKANKKCPNFRGRRTSIASEIGFNRSESRLSTRSSIGDGIIRKCTACGALGHDRASHICPNWKPLEMRRKLDEEQAQQRRSEVLEEKKKALKRKIQCGACGAFGHYRTNKKCPLFGRKDAQISETQAQAKINDYFANVDMNETEDQEDWDGMLQDILEESPKKAEKPKKSKKPLTKKKNILHDDLHMSEDEDSEIFN